MFHLEINKGSTRQNGQQYQQFFICANKGVQPVTFWSFSVGLVSTHPKTWPWMKDRLPHRESFPRFQWLKRSGHRGGAQRSFRKVLRRAMDWFAVLLLIDCSWFSLQLNVYSNKSHLAEKCGISCRGPPPVHNLTWKGSPICPGHKVWKWAYSSFTAKNLTNSSLEMSKTIRLPCLQQPMHFILLPLKILRTKRSSDDVQMSSSTMWSDSKKRTGVAAGGRSWNPQWNSTMLGGIPKKRLQTQPKQPLSLTKNKIKRRRLMFKIKKTFQKCFQLIN